VKVGGFGNAVRPEGIPYAARSSPSPRFHLVRRTHPGHVIIHLNGSELIF
jgi:hypothetical protein